MSFHFLVLLGAIASTVVSTPGLQDPAPQRLTRHEANDRYPAWSPDGERIAFESDRDGNFEIYVMSADGKYKHNLTQNPGDDAAPSWSPDGKKILFHSNRYEDQEEIYVMHADGSNTVRMTQGAETTRAR